MVGIYNLAHALQKKYYLNIKRQNYEINGILLENNTRIKQHVLKKQ